MLAEKSRRSFFTKLMTIVAGVWVGSGSTACDREVATKYGGPPTPGPEPKYGGPPELLSAPPPPPAPPPGSTDAPPK